MPPGTDSWRTTWAPTGSLSYLGSEACPVCTAAHRWKPTCAGGMPRMPIPALIAAIGRAALLSPHTGHAVFAPAHPARVTRRSRNASRPAHRSRTHRIGSL
jgi:hypothetical protein